MKHTRLVISSAGYFLALCLYSLFSFALTAPNLTLLNWAPYTQFQAWMWTTLFNNRPLLSTVYLMVIDSVWFTYWLLTIQLAKLKSLPITRFFSPWLLGAVLIVSPLLFANTAISYDVFNYIFNAKMVVVYQANPHIKVALDFATDPWVRFMHNTHTAAPYGYGWTAVSLLPYVIGRGSFLATWLLFRIMSVISWLGLIAVLVWASRDRYPTLSLPTVALTVLNPLVVIEVIATSHNDLWMMVPAVWALLLLSPGRRISGRNLILSMLLLVFSISIKFATLVLVPLWLLLLLSHQAIDWPWLKSLPGWNWLSNLLNSWWPVVASLLMFIPLLTSRSQQFHPWYLTWVLVWLPLFATQKNVWVKRWQLVILTFSITALLRYLPYLWLGQFTAESIGQQKLITWLPAVVVAIISLLIPQRSSK